MFQPHNWRRLMTVAAILAGGALPVSAAPDVPIRASISEAYGRLPLSFEANAGQLDKAVRFVSRGQGYTLFLTSAEAVLSLRDSHNETAVVRMQLAGGKRAPRVVGLDPQSTKSNYLLGNDPSQWHTGISHYARVRYENVYPDVDLIYRGNQRQLEYDFVLAPGADPRKIRMVFQGADSITVGAHGELVLHTAQGDIVQHSPVVYQKVGKERQPVEGRYVLLVAPGSESAARQVGFSVGRYDRSQPLIIDPVLVYSTFLGGLGFDRGVGIAVDSTGSAYITGSTQSPTFPGVTGGSLQPANGSGGDAFVTKINPTGTSIVYSTFLGGNGLDEGEGIAVDGAGNAYITGQTLSTTFPGVNGSSLQPANGGLSDAFVTKLDPTGTTTVYSTFLGGSGPEQGRAIAVDSAGSAYVTGETGSTTFPGVNGSSLQPANSGGTDVFVTKLTPAGTAIAFSTFLGGTGSDVGHGLAVDGVNNVYVTGITHSLTFPGVNSGSLQPAYGGGDFDAFVIKLKPAGTGFVYATFLGGAGAELGLRIAADNAGNAFVVGETRSGTFPGVNGNSLQSVYGGGLNDGYVAKINPTGTAFIYSTLLGGSGSEQATGIAIDATGNAYITGNTTSTTFPGVNANSIQPASGGGPDAFVVKINPTGTAFVYSTFLGGSGTDGGDTIAVDSAGNAYVTGGTDSTAFPGVNVGSIQPANASGTSDGFVTKIGKAVGALTTQASPSVSVGGSISDAATLAGGASPTGTITFNLFGPENASCAGSPIFTVTNTVNGNGNYTSGTFIASSAGTYRWVATYSGDAENNAAGPTGCDDPAETVVVTAVSPTLTTQASPSVPVGGSISDTSTLAAGASPTGTITFNLFGPNNASCTGGPIFTATKTVTGNGNYTSNSFTASSAGTYRWIASYGGDTNNNAAGPTGCGDPAEAVVVTAVSPTLNTQASPSVSVGGSISDTATLAAGATPTGTITFNLFGPDNASCAGSPIFTSTKTVTSNSNCTANSFTATSAGTYRWIASYGGDTNNNAAGPTGCSDPAETVVVTAVSPTLTTQASPSVSVGSSISDTATLTAGASPTGTITFSLFGPDNASCAGSPIFTSTKIVTGNGNYSSNSFTASSAGTYRWIASYGGDMNNNAAGPTGCSDPEEAVVVRSGLLFHTVMPCRIVDTRNSTGPLGGPALQAGVIRTFVVSGICGVPSSAKALSVNVADTQPTASGYLLLFPGDQFMPPNTSTLNYGAGQTRTNNAIAQLALDGSGRLNIFSSASVHFILDVNGYFE